MVIIKFMNGVSVALEFSHSYVYYDAIGFYLATDICCFHLVLLKCSFRLTISTHWLYTYI